MKISRVFLTMAVVAMVGFAQSGCINVSGEAYYNTDEGEVAFVFPMQIGIQCISPNQWTIASGWVYGAAVFSISAPFAGPGTCTFTNVWGFECIENCEFDVVAGQ